MEQSSGLYRSSPTEQGCRCPDGLGEWEGFISQQVAQIWKGMVTGDPGSISTKGLQAPRGKLLRGGETTQGESHCGVTRENQQGHHPPPQSIKHRTGPTPPHLPPI